LINFTGYINFTKGNQTIRKYHQTIRVSRNTKFAKSQTKISLKKLRKTIKPSHFFEKTIKPSEKNPPFNVDLKTKDLIVYDEYSQDFT
jgi:hypothetical protein